MDRTVTCEEDLARLIAQAEAVTPVPRDGDAREEDANEFDALNAATKRALQRLSRRRRSDKPCASSKAEGKPSSSGNQRCLFAGWSRQLVVRLAALQAQASGEKPRCTANLQVEENKLFLQGTRIQACSTKVATSTETL